jgi:3-oxoacyl-[acyl-carrier-protein] synthase II
VRVSGVGVVSVFGTTHDAFCQALLEGRSGISRLTGFDIGGCRTTVGAELAGFDATAWVPPMKLRRLDRTGVYAIAATKLALDDARTIPPTEGTDSIGVVVGTSTAGGQSTQVFLDALFRRGPAGAPALLFDSTVGNSAAALAALDFKLRGPNVTLSQKEASGLAAVVTAVDLLREGRASALVACGVEAIYETVFKAHDRFKVMSADTAFSNRLSPFDDARSGWVMGEGGFGLWLEPHDDAIASSDSRHGEILGVAASGAAISLNAWPDDPEPLARTMSQALEDGGLRPTDVDVVYASANASGVLDATEARAIGCLFGNTPVVTSIKGALGESGAASTAACCAALLCGARGEVPPIAGLSAPCAEASLLRLARQRTPAPGPTVLVNGFASGGALFSVVLRVVYHSKSSRDALLSG